MNIQMIEQLMNLPLPPAQKEQLFNVMKLTKAQEVMAQKVMDRFNSNQVKQSVANQLGISGDIK